MIKVDSTEQGLKFAEEMVAFDGLGHSAAIHTADEELVKTFGSRVKALRVIWNSPSTFGGIGDVVQRLPAFSDPRLRLLR